MFHCTTDNLESWSSHTGMKFSSRKTKCIIFTKRRNSSAPNFTINNVPILNVDCIKSLDLIFNKKLTWNPGPLLDYASIAYSSAYPRVLKMLDTVHNTGLHLAWKLCCLGWILAIPC